MRTKKSDMTLVLLKSISGKALTVENFLCSIRECEEMTQVTFAKKLGISCQYVCDLEHNSKRLSPEMAARFAQKLGYSEDHLICFIQLNSNGITKKGAYIFKCIRKIISLTDYLVSLL